MKPEIILIPAGIAAVFGVMGWAFGRAGWRRGGTVIAALCWVVVAGFYLMANLQTGWDALGWFIGAMIFALPAAAGMTLGLWLGLRVRRRLDPS